MKSRKLAFLWIRATSGSLLLIKSVDDTLEVSNLQSSTTNQTTVYIRICKQFLCIGRLAATTVKDRAVFSNFLAILLGNGRTDESMDFLCLCRSSSLTCTDGPNRFVSQDNLGEIFGRQREYRCQLSGNHFILLVSFTFFQHFTDTENPRVKPRSNMCPQTSVDITVLTAFV